MPSLSVQTNAADAVANAMAYISGVAQAPTSFALNDEIGRAVTTIAGRSLAQFIDAEARLNPEALHHVYEWNQTGKPLGRLWKVTGAYRSGMIVLNSEFRQSRTFVPIKNGTSRRSKFVYKAQVMEEGKSVRIAPKNAEALFFFSKSGEPVFIPRGRSVVVKTPGGKYVRGSYAKTLNRFLTSPRLMIDLAESGLVKRLEDAQGIAARQMPSTVAGRRSTNSFNRLAESNVSKHIRQVTRAYQVIDNG